MTQAYPHRLLALAALCLGLLVAPAALRAQDAEEEEQPEGWTRGAAFGLDLGQLLQLNPRIGAGENRIGLGTNFATYARLKRGRLNWDNNASLNFAIQRLGSGVLPPGFNDDEKVPYQKSIDELRLASQIGYSFSEVSHWGYGAEATFLTQLTPTYQDAAGRNVLKDIDGSNAGGPIAMFLSPATFTLSPGITYRPNDHFDALLPASYKTVFVSDETIRQLEIYDFLDTDDDGVNESLQQFGASLRANYANTFLEDDRLIFKSTLGLFSNYLNNPQNIDIDWRNEVGFEIVKGLTATLNTTLLYDDDLDVQVSDFDAVGGIERNPDGSPRLGKRPTFIQQLLVKYAVVF